MRLEPAGGTPQFPRLREAASNQVTLVERAAKSERKYKYKILTRDDLAEQHTDRAWRVPTEERVCAAEVQHLGAPQRQHLLARTQHATSGTPAVVSN